MGSQQIYHELHTRAPKAIVVRVGTGWRVATPVKAEQPDRTAGGIGPVVLVYEMGAGRPYRSESAAVTDAALIVAREEREP